MDKATELTREEFMYKCAMHLKNVCDNPEAFNNVPNYAKKTYGMVTSHESYITFLRTFANSNNNEIHKCVISAGIVEGANYDYSKLKEMDHYVLVIHYFNKFLGLYSSLDEFVMYQEAHNNFNSKFYGVRVRTILARYIEQMHVLFEQIGKEYAFFINFNKNTLFCDPNRLVMLSNNWVF